MLVLTVRAFDVRAVYEELDGIGWSEENNMKKGEKGEGEGTKTEGDDEGRKEGHEPGKMMMKKMGKIEDVEGERAYQILWATAKPKAGLPARVVRTGR